MVRRAKQKPFWPYGLLIFAVLLAIDQITKRIIVSTYALGESHRILPGLWFTHLQNTGALWSSFQDTNVAFMWLSVVAFGVLIYFFDAFETRIEKICYTLILAGLWGNLIDRATFGSVIDFIDLRWWPVFNVADSCIVVAVIVFLITHYRKTKTPVVKKRKN